MVTAEMMIERGWCVRPAKQDKYPGVKSTAKSFTLADMHKFVSLDRWNVIVGSSKAPNRSGILDVETDGEIGERNFLRACGGVIPPGPWMETPSGSKHRIFLWPELKDNEKVRIGPGLMMSVDVPWQFLALDGEGRVWHDWELEVPELPSGLRDLVVVEVRTVLVEAGEWEGEGAGEPEAVEWLEGRCRAIKEAPAPYFAPDGSKVAGEWNRTFSLAVFGAAGLVSSGQLSEDYAHEKLYEACDDPEEAEAVYEASWRSGLQEPWRVESVDERAEDVIRKWMRPTYEKAIQKWSKQIREDGGFIKGVHRRNVLWDIAVGSACDAIEVEGLDQEMAVGYVVEKLRAPYAACDPAWPEDSESLAKRVIVRYLENVQQRRNRKTSGVLGRSSNDNQSIIRNGNGV